MRSCDFVNHSYDYGPNWTPLSPITIISLQHQVPFVTFSTQLEKFPVL